MGADGSGCTSSVGGDVSVSTAGSRVVCLLKNGENFLKYCLLRRVTLPVPSTLTTYW
ncbi:hypothetical protein DPMN_164397 [Dreissena polymorpha]|uniref:Uncharacterized protein n=1 Tax=Dreissena polymorpha TaxID=45954 RepID=A0A9D4ISB4_DREPO|nr:hypothetical protein DPMN_164397 [Dreissena polymorpha]